MLCCAKMVILHVLWFLFLAMTSSYAFSVRRGDITMDWSFKQMFPTLKESTFGSSSGRSEVSKLVSYVNSQANRGINRMEQTIIKEMIDNLVQEKLPLSYYMQRNPKLDALGSINGSWSLLWTTEKETLFFAERGLFGAKCTNIVQDIDFKTNSIKNRIEFERNRVFSVDGTLTKVLRPAFDSPISSVPKDSLNPRSLCRAYFKFDRARLQLGGGWTLPPPAIGQGWFDNVYVDDAVRIAVDSRGDYLIFQRRT